jgi:hypothetical protein
MARPTTYSPLIIPIVRACATFGATAPEIANYIGTSVASFDRWTMKHEELREALKRGREASDERVVDSLYRLAIGWNGLPPNLGACCFWLKNRRPSEWRDVHNIDQAIGHYIISDRPLTEDEWIEQRTKFVEDKRSPAERQANTSDADVVPPVSDAKQLDTNT